VSGVPTDRYTPRQHRLAEDVKARRWTTLSRWRSAVSKSTAHVLVAETEVDMSRFARRASALRGGACPAELRLRWEKPFRPYQARHHLVTDRAHWAAPAATHVPPAHPSSTPPSHSMRPDE